MSTPMRKVAMCLMAHPDDCEILAAGTLIALARRNWQIHIVTVTPGDCGSAELPPQEIAAIRRSEGAAAASLINANYHCLEANDLYVTFEQALIRRAMALTRHIAPTLMITHSLDDYMMDHEVTARIARAVSFGYAVPNATVGPLPPGASVPCLYYADPIGGTDVFGRPIAADICVDITDQINTKTDMLKAHASQRDWLMKHHGMDHYIQSMQQWAAKRGCEINAAYAEGLRQHKAHPYPQQCLLTQELGQAVRTPAAT